MEEWDGEQQQDGGEGEAVVVTFEVSPPDVHIAQFVVATSLVGPAGTGKTLKVRREREREVGWIVLGGGRGSAGHCTHSCIPSMQSTHAANAMYPSTYRRTGRRHRAWW